MRLLFLFLVLVNGLVYLWYTFHQQPLNASPVSLQAGYPQLVLLSELPEESKIVPIPNVIVPGGASETHQVNIPQRSCYTLGPFMNSEDVSRAAEVLIQSGRPIEKRASEKKEQIGYWV
ncbi:MAG TPA: hypothetical protein VIU36_06745, partial [Gammaproteobacteria bacterium]